MSLQSHGGCCAPIVPDIEPDPHAAVRSRLGPLDPYLKAGEDGTVSLNMMIEGISCGGCIARIEQALKGESGVAEARVNFSTSRLKVVFDPAQVAPENLIVLLDGLGYRAVPYDPAVLRAGRDEEERRLLRAMAVAGFAAANVMLLSVAVWAGHFQDMGPATRTLLHWISALVATPAVIYAGRPFFESALSALRAGRTNMDVPISLAVMLATGMSVMETLRGAEHAYFDSAITLLFFLLIGRYLDRRARGRARSAAEQLTGLSAMAVIVVETDGTLRVCAPASVTTGMVVLVPAGDRIPVDGTVLTGTSDIDNQLITGESVPEPAGPGTDVYAGAVNLGAPLKLTVRVAGEGTLLAEIARLMEAAEQRRTRYVGMADAVAHWYAPVVHMLALSAFIGWFVFGGLAWQESLMIAIAVLIITCPCALGLAVPVVQVIACSRLMRQGILLKSGSALERLAQIDMVVFDKTGTLTVGRPELVNAVACDSDVLRQAAGIASASLHPLAKALVAAAGPGIKAADGVLEKPGAGLTWNGSVGPHRLGNRSFVGLSPKSVDSFSDDVIGPEIWYARPDHEPVCYRFTDALRSDAGAVIRSLEEMGIEVRLLSGDRPGAVSAAAWALGIDNWQAQVSPDGKLRYLEGLRRTGRRPVMVGDGLNDAPALAAAFVSLSPASGADISRTAADIVFQGERLAPILESLKVARTSERLVKQNFLLAFLYNIVTVPIAIAGHVTPLIAAIAMSGSSLIVIGNALRMNWVGGVWTGGGWTKPRWSAKLLPIEPQPVAPCDIERGTQS